MENFIQNTILKLKDFGELFKSNRKIQLLVLAGYLLLWLISSGSLSITIWVGVGIGLGWFIGRGDSRDL